MEHTRFLKMKKRIFTLGKRLDDAEAEATRLRGLVDLVNKYQKERLVTDRKKMFELAKELRDE